MAVVIVHVGGFIFRYPDDIEVVMRTAGRAVAGESVDHGFRIRPDIGQIVLLVLGENVVHLTCPQTGKKD